MKFCQINSKTSRKRPIETTRTDWLKILFLSLNENTELERALDVMNDGASKENLQFDHQSKRIVFKFFFCRRIS